MFCGGEPFGEAASYPGMTQSHPQHVERLDHDPNPPAVKPATQARQGNILGVMRYVLIISVALTILGYLIVYALG
jgi:hypothetical protein